MKTRLNLTIEDSLIQHVKEYAASKQISISQMVEDYFKNITQPSPKKESIIDIVEKLDSPILNKDTDLKKIFYEEQAGKYGF
ncbi:DUF6364 family protein [Dyadobacter sp. CY356]|uniref:DUF6364 family protein n=1 Tax=Dyadobacter sp. CY356 TaxID=2906442 RepID=UPI001F4532A6|nr:DUF6364 family protein [Dyadobacter sp. CY356]MCF0059430.1 DUF6364 family protein [Dyadobacter sp. CY356]